MALSLLLALSTAPAIIGTQEAVNNSQRKQRREEHRARRSNLIVSCVKSSSRSAELNNKAVILTNNKLYVNTGVFADIEEGFEKGAKKPHAFTGYFLPYPDTNYEGLVSTISDEAPILNWIYVDKETYEVKYGVRELAQPNLTGPFDATRQDRRLSFDGWEGFVAVEEYENIWALYFDFDDSGLRGKVPDGARILEVEIIRREQKLGKPGPDEPKTLEEMYQRQLDERAKEEEEAERERREIEERERKEREKMEAEERRERQEREIEERRARAREESARREQENQEREREEQERKEQQKRDLEKLKRNTQNNKRGMQQPFAVRNSNGGGPPASRRPSQAQSRNSGATPARLNPNNARNGNSRINGSDGGSKIRVSELMTEMNKLEDEFYKDAQQDDRRRDDGRRDAPRYRQDRDRDRDRERDRPRMRR